MRRQNESEDETEEKQYETNKGEEREPDTEATHPEESPQSHEETGQERNEEVGRTADSVFAQNSGKSRQKQVISRKKDLRRQSLKLPHTTRGSKKQQEEDLAGKVTKRAGGERLKRRTPQKIVN